MAENLPISGLPISSALDGTELFAIVQDGETRKASILDIPGLSGGFFGVWSALVAYTENNLVVYDNIIWKAISPNINEAPGTGPSWEILSYLTQGTNTLTEPLLLEGQVFFVGDNGGNGYISLNNDIGAAQILNSAGDGILLNNGIIEITVSSSLKIEVTSNNVRLLTNLSLGGNPVYYRNAASPSAGDLREVQVGTELQLQEYNGVTWDIRGIR